MPMSATAIVLPKSERPRNTWRGINAALQDTGVNGNK